MSSLAESIAANPPLDPDSMELGDDSGDNLQFHEACLEEIDRHRRLDQWIPSFHNILSTAALDCRARLMKAGIIPTSATDFLQYTRDGCFPDLRLNAFSNLIDLGLIQKMPIMKWFLFALGNDASPYIRTNLGTLFGQLLGSIAIGEDQSSAPQARVQSGGLVVEQESSTEARQADFARKKTVKGAKEALRREFGQHSSFKEALWEAIQSPLLSLDEVYELLHVCSLLYDPVKSQVVIMRYKRHWRLYSHGKNTVPSSVGDFSQNQVLSHVLTFRRDGRVKTERDPPLWRSGFRETLRLERQRTGSYSAAPEKAVRPLLKGPKRSKNAKTAVPTASSTPSFQNGIDLGEDISKPKLTLKFKLPKKD